MGDEKLAKRAGGQEVEGKEDRNCDGDCLRDIERKREEWRKSAIERRNWRLLREKKVK